MPTDLPVDFNQAKAVLAVYRSGSGTSADGWSQSLLAATAANPVRTFVIKPGENLARRTDVVTTKDAYIFTINPGTIRNLSSDCFQLDLSTAGITGTLDAKWKMSEQASIAILSDKAGTFNAALSCLMEKARPNINWKPGVKRTMVKLTLSKKYVNALRAASPNGVTFNLEIFGYVAGSSSSDDDK